METFLDVGAGVVMLLHQMDAKCAYIRGPDPSHLLNAIHAVSLKIIFVCSSLHPSKDGVGDYCRRLAAELTAQGNQCGLLSISDRYISSVIITTQTIGDFEMPVMRLPAPGLSVKENSTKAKKWIDEFNPQWLSLQYVTFGYHPKGLKFGLGRELMALSAGRQWQIMFHELWVGMAKEEPAKLYWWGMVQKFLIKALIKELQPAVIHTQTRLYQQLIAKMGYQADYLPLFGNIPVQKRIRYLANDPLIFLVFGTIHSGAPIHKLAKAVSVYATQHRKEIALMFIGHCGPEQDRWAKIWQAENLPVNILGPQPPELISEMMFQATIGISATALAVVEKSGSFAAMREHGLPVMSLSKPWTPLGAAMPAIPQGIIPYQNNLEECLAFKVDAITNNSVSAVSVKFAEALKNVKGLSNE